MLIAIQKVRITVASNGAFKSNGLLVKDPQGNFFLLTNHALPFPTGTTNEQLVGAIAPHVTHEGALLYYPINAVTRSLDSFATTILAMEGTSGYRDYGYEMLDDGFMLVDLSNIPEIVLDTPSSASVDMDGVAVKGGYTTTYTYTGFGGYHSNQRNTSFNTPLATDKPWRIGVELELYARNREAFNKITGARSNWFQCERDASLSERIDNVPDLGIEIKSIPLKACDAKSVDFWAAPMAKLAQLAKSKRNVTTGLHVHIGKEILGSTDRERETTLEKLTWFYYYLVEDVPANHAKNVVICGRERGYCTQLGAGKTTLGDFCKKMGPEAVKLMNPEAFHEMTCSVKDKIREKRDDINLKHLDTYGTIEFRKGKGCIGKTRMAALVTWWEQMCIYCRETPGAELSFNAFFDKVTRENPAVAYFFNSDEEV